MDENEKRFFDKSWKNQSGKMLRRNSEVGIPGLGIVNLSKIGLSLSVEPAI